jgi:hypothetical protein
LGSSATRIKAPDDLLMPPTDPIGMRLLSKMGWKPGQGIGARVKRNARKRPLAVAESTTAAAASSSSGKRVYGLQVSIEELKQDRGDEEGGDAGDGSFDPHAQGFTFAPKDVNVTVDLQGKHNVHGLGYDPYQHTPDFKGTHTHTHTERERSASMLRYELIVRVVNTADNLGQYRQNASDQSYRLEMGGGKSKLASNFGYGVLEEGDDEVEVYGSEDSMCHSTVPHRRHTRP